MCQVEKELTDFPKNGKDRYGNIMYRPECKPCHSAEKKKKYAEDGVTASKQKEQKKKRYWNDPDFKQVHLEYNRAWYSYKYANDQGFKDRNNKRGYAWKKTPKGKASAQSVSSTRRARLKGARVSEDVLQREKQFRLSMTKCANCETTERLSLDHIVPLSKGGIHDLDNWQCLCVPCNSRKRDCLL